MADTVNFLQNGYSGEVLEDLLTYTVQGNDTVREGLIHIKTGIQHRYTLPAIKPPSELINTRIQEGRMIFSKKSNSSLKREVVSSVTRPKKRITAGWPAFASPTTY